MTTHSLGTVSTPDIVLGKDEMMATATYLDGLMTSSLYNPADVNRDEDEQGDENHRAAQAEIDAVIDMLGEIKDVFASAESAEVVATRYVHRELSGLDRYQEAVLVHRTVTDAIKQQIVKDPDFLRKSVKEKLEQWGGEVGSRDELRRAIEAQKRFSDYINAKNYKALDDALSSGAMDDLIRELPHGKEWVEILRESREQVAMLEELYQRYHDLATKALNAIVANASVIERNLELLAHLDPQIRDLYGRRNVGFAQPVTQVAIVNIFQSAGAMNFSRVDYTETRPNPDVHPDKVYSGTGDLATKPLGELVEANKALHDSPELRDILLSETAQAMENIKRYMNQLRGESHKLAREVDTRWGAIEAHQTRWINQAEAEARLERTTPRPTERAVQARADELLQQGLQITEAEASQRVQAGGAEGYVHWYARTMRVTLNEARDTLQNNAPLRDMEIDEVANELVRLGVAVDPVAARQQVRAEGTESYIHRYARNHNMTLEEARTNLQNNAPLRGQAIMDAASELVRLAPAIRRPEALARARAELNRTRVTAIRAEATRLVGLNRFHPTFVEALERQRNAYLTEHFVGQPPRLPNLTMVRQRLKEGTLAIPDEEQRTVLQTFDLMFTLCEQAEGGAKLFPEAQNRLYEQRPELRDELANADAVVQSIHEEIHGVLRREANDADSLRRKLGELGRLQANLQTATKNYLRVSRQAAREIGGLMNDEQAALEQKLKELTIDLYERMANATIDGGARSKWLAMGIQTLHQNWAYMVLAVVFLSFGVGIGEALANPKLASLINGTSGSNTQGH